jgi:phytoene dehydrogenase-like protein
MPSCDAIVIGGGVNGLAAATRLAQGGRRVMLIEAAAELGGAMRGHELVPGFRSPGLAHILHQLDARVAAGMDLARHGLRFAATNLASTALSASGDHLVLDGAFGATLAGNIAPKDQAAWAALRAQLLSFAGVLAPFKAITPPRLARGAGDEMLHLARLGLGVRALGRPAFRDLLRMMLTNVADVLDEDLGDDRLKAVVAFDATLGAWLGPQSPNSLILLLNRLAAEVAGQRAALALPQGGMGAVADAIAAAAEAAGVVIRRGSAVSGLIVEADEVAGVRLAHGEALHARVVVSAISPQVTLLSLLGPRYLDAGFVTRLRQIKARGAAAKLHLALAAAPDFRGADLRSRLVIAPSVRAVETAFNAVKYGAVPGQPVMEIVLPSAHEAGHAPPGQHVLSAIVQFAPHAPKAGPDAARSAMLQAALAQLEAYAPGIGATILHSELLMPYDIAARYGMAGGNWHHAELSAEQMLFLRPLPELAQYATPMKGLWLAGAGNHPGGGISGAAGWNAAERIIKVVRA